MSDTTDFTLRTEVPRAFEETLEAVRAALTDQGFGILTEIDLAGTFKKKLDKDTPPQVILGACRPQLAYEAVSQEPAVAALLPCNVVVRQASPDSTVVEAFDPAAMTSLGGAAVEEVAADAKQRLQAALDSLAG